MGTYGNRVAAVQGDLTNPKLNEKNDEMALQQRRNTLMRNRSIFFSNGVPVFLAAGAPPELPARKGRPWTSAAKRPREGGGGSLAPGWVNKSVEIWLFLGILM